MSPSNPLIVTREITRLKITDDKGFEKVVLIDRDDFTIGRGDQCALVLPPDAGPTVAEVHARLTRPEANRFLLADLSGSCGTRVNGRPIRQADLRHGDLVTLGLSTYRLHFLVEGTRAADHEEKRIRALLDVLQHMHSCLDVEEISARAVVGVMGLLNATWVQVLVGSDPDRLKVASAGDAESTLPAKPTRTARQVVASNRSMNQPDQLCAPIGSRDGLLGAIDVGPRTAKPYQGTDLEMLELLASHVGIAVANARRIQELPGLVATARQN